MVFYQCPNAFVSNFVGASWGGISIGGGVCKASLKLIWSWAIVGTQCSQLPPRPHRLLPKGWNETKGNSSVIKTNQARFNLHISLNNEHFYLSLDQEGKIWRALAERAGSSSKGRTPNIVNIVAIYTLFLKTFVESSCFQRVLILNKSQLVLNLPVPRDPCPGGIGSKSTCSTSTFAGIPQSQGLGGWARLFPGR